MKQKTRRVSLNLIRSIFLSLIALVLLWSIANAGFKSGGAGNCGDFATAIELAEDGDIIAQMIPEKDSSSVVITKNLRISGGWFPTVDCETNNQEFATIGDFLDYGFDYQAPDTRSILSHDNGSVLNIGDATSPDFPQLDKLIIEHFELHTSAIPDNGGGINGVIGGSTVVLLDNLFFDDNYVNDYGGGLKLEAWENSHLIIEDSLFEFNEAQTKIHKAIEKQIKEKGRVRALVLKARQQGISTYTAGRVFWKTFYTAHTRSVVIAHDSATSDALFTMSKNFIDRMSDDFKPELVRSNAKEVKFSHNDSGYRLYTAGSPEAGRGTTPTILHCSECAFWQNDDKILAGLFQGVSSSDGTEIILESTANGATGAFYRMWKAAERGENDYVPIFLPWFMTKEYTMDPPDNFERTIEENEIAEEYDLSDGQLWWRRMKIGEGGESKFRQEYPSTAEEAFVSQCT